MEFHIKEQGKLRSWLMVKLSSETKISMSGLTSDPDFESLNFFPKSILTEEKNVQTKFSGVIPNK